MEASEFPPVIDQTISHYRVIGKLAVCAMGVIYEAPLEAT
jgi:hypothetical protein